MKRRDALKNTALLGGAILSTSSMLGLLQSCQQEPRLSWQPSFLNTEQAQLISALVDAILPKTETPGGLDMKVDVFIDKVLADLYNEEGQQSVIEEMTQFNEKCKAKFGKLFHQLDATQKETILQVEEENSPKYNSGIWGTAIGEQEPVGFYRSIKSMAIWGYCTSEEIGRNVLNYDPVPGDYVGCVPLNEVGKVWSL